MLKPQKPKKLTLGEPPKDTEIRHTLYEDNPPPIIATNKVDGRTLRRTGRTAQFNVMISPDFRDSLAQAATQERLTYQQLLALMFRAYSDLPNETKQAYITELTRQSSAL